MISEIQLEIMRDLFCVEKEIVLMELREMLEKLKIVEDELRNTSQQTEDDIDSYKPCTGAVYPPKKKMKMC
jgi:hypothetical protein